MKKHIPLYSFLFVVFLQFVFTNVSNATNKNHKPRVIITADPELDDNNSLIRFLLYSSDMQVEGLVYASSQFHWKGDGKGTKFMVPGREYTRYGLNLCPCESYRWKKDERFIHEAVEAYEKVYNNLIVHNKSYPTPAYLKSKIKYGNIEFEGDFSKNTEGSELIKKAILDSKPGPLYITAWGGASTIARALKSIEDSLSASANWASIKKNISAKVVLLLSGDQDNTHASYILPNWPAMAYKQFKNGPNYGYGAQLVANKDNAPLLTTAWMNEHILSKGPLGQIYRTWGDGKQMVKNDPFDYFGLDGYTNEQLKAMGYIVWMPKQEKGSWLGEGDTGTFMNLLDNGLNAIQDGYPGGWGGRYYQPNPSKDINPFSNDTSKVKDLVISASMLKKMDEAKEDLTEFPNFFPAAQLDFATRMQWSVTNTYKKANHAPIINTVSSLKVKAGSTIRVHASVKEPDGDQYALKWWQFSNSKKDPQLVIQEASGLYTNVQIPANLEPNQPLFLVAEVKDQKQLTTYKTIKIEL